MQNLESVAQKNERVMVNLAKCLMNMNEYEYEGKVEKHHLLSCALRAS